MQSTYSHTFWFVWTLAQAVSEDGITLGLLPQEVPILTALFRKFAVREIHDRCKRTNQWRCEQLRATSRPANSAPFSFFVPCSQSLAFTLQSCRPFRMCRRTFYTKQSSRPCGMIDAQKVLVLIIAQGGVCWVWGLIVPVLTMEHLQSRQECT